MHGARLGKAGLALALFWMSVAVFGPLRTGTAFAEQGERAFFDPNPVSASSAVYGSEVPGDSEAGEGRTDEGTGAGRSDRTATSGEADSIANAAGLSIYPLPSIYSASTSYALKADSINVPVVSYAQYDYAHFSMAEGPVTLEVTALGKSSIDAYRITPKKLNLPATANGNKLTFTLQDPQYLIVKISDQKELVIAVDPGETDKPAASGSGIYNVLNAPYQADNTGAAMATAAVQQAIDDASAYAGGQGIVYVPAGVYKMGNLELKSDVALYLEGGAVFRFTGNPADYTTHWHKDSQDRDITWWLYTPSGATNVKLYGRGTLDGNGKFATETYDYGNNILVPIGVSGFAFDGLVVRDSGSWAVTPARSDHLTFTNMKIFNRLDMGENDGIDVNESQRVRVENAIGIALDDPFSTKTWDQSVDISLDWPGSPEPNEDIEFDNLLAWTYCYAFKIGQGMRQNQSDITFKNGVVYNASIGFGIDHKYGAGTISGATFENIDIEQVGTWNGPLRTWSDFVIQGADGYGGGPIDGLTVRNINVRDRGMVAARLKGFSLASRISGATFDNVRMPGSAEPAKTLHEMNILDRAYLDPVTILPVQAQEPVQRPNLAKGRPATASSSTADPSLSVDGNYGTRWGSNYTDAEWYSVDLGSTRKIDAVKIYWEAAYGRSYQIQTSTDGANWQTVFGTTAGDGGTDDIAFAPVNARYVKMNGTQRGTGWGYSMWEFEVYGDADNLAAGATVSATSSVENANWSYSKAVDGQRNSVSGSMGWTSNNSLTTNHTEAVTLDLGAARTVGRVDLYPRNDAGNVGQNFPIDFTIRTSTDNVNWTTRVTRTGYAQPGNAVQSFAFPAATARYVKIEGTNLRPNPTDANRYRMAFAEIEVYGA